MYQTAVWQRRTNKIIATGITIIGLTMMLSLIPQCIYIGIVFVSASLVWLGWMTIRDKQKQQQVDSTGTDHQGHHHTTSPVLFLVASHHLRQSPRGPTLPDPNDKPPTYDQIVKLDGLPPDYYTVLTTEKPPRYEDVGGRGGGLGWGACASPMDLYSPDLACIHTTQPTLFLHQHQHTDNTTTTTKTTTQPSVTHQHNTTTTHPTPTQQQQHITTTTTTTHPSVFFQEPATSWSELGNHQHHHQHQGYSAAAHNPAFASDDPTVLPFVLEMKDSATSQPSPTSPATDATTTTDALSSPPAFQETT
ncbi:hypothetical protein Pmani_004599 [Petrolisthes manimaculis]|uniref:Uncharacterized protein n=1 Tax=Petrolisthes manimaculis TaxID=1843537 RepID=A0AAE1QGJ8_9EUCA|nr:hypothetical protein Pmani_004599 [Petrolisthes manimaculis]